MDLNNYITFDGVTSSSLSTYISGEGSFDAPERVYDMQTIPGRNGALAIDEGRFENIEITYPAFIFTNSGTDFETKLAALRNEILSRKGYKRLSDTYHPDEFRLAIYKSGLEVSPKDINRAGQFNLVFDCKPQRFLTSGETVVTKTASGYITNPTNFDAKPLLVVTGTGTLTVNGVAIAITATPTTIDCEAMEAYNGTTSRNGSITLSPNRFPVLSPGSNNITLSSGISKVEITPRWWRV